MSFVEITWSNSNMGYHRLVDTNFNGVLFSLVPSQFFREIVRHYANQGLDGDDIVRNLVLCLRWMKNNYYEINIFNIVKQNETFLKNICGERLEKYLTLL